MAYSNILDPSAHFQTKVYTGTNANQSITNDGNSDLQPDLIFASYRTTPPYTNHRAIIDSSRGRAKILESDTTAAEATTTNAAYDLVSFDTDGFTVGAVNSTSALNASGISNVAWQWKANGGTTASNTDGVISSTVQVNSDAGFSILTYTMGSGNETVGHGLGVTPDIVITKARFRGDSNGFWSFYTTVLDGSLDYFKLNEDGYKFNSSLAAPTSTVFTGAGSGTVAYRDFVAYCFASKQGYSKFGKYVGNGNANGPFVYTGFKPAFVLIKADSNYKYWYIFDNKRNEFNLVNTGINPSLPDAEITNNDIGLDFLSNGFKIRNSSTTLNQNTTNMIYMAFAENPFVAGGVPTTAR
jgi:hypothetical protein